MSRVAAIIAATPLLVRIAAGVSWFGVMVAIMMARDSITAMNVISRAASWLDALGFPAAMTGVVVFVIWTATPLVLLAIADTLRERIQPFSVGRWLSVPFFGMAVSGQYSRDEAFEILSPTAAAVYDWLLSATLIVLFVGLAAYGLVKLVRWLIEDERSARASG